MTDSIATILAGLLKNEQSFKLFFLGLAKNTGKTTTLNYVLANLNQQTNRPLVVLSSGYDGEELDAISGLPKPKISLNDNMFFVSTDLLIAKFYDRCKVITRYPLHTPFGQLVLAKALTIVSVPLVSPGSVTAMQKVIRELNKNIINPIFLIDGSINRKAFLNIGCEADRVMLATGASFSTDHKEQIDSLSLLCQLFTLPVSCKNQPGILVDILDKETIQRFKNETIIVPSVASIFVHLSTLIQFFRWGNQLLLKRSPPGLTLITFNPYNLYTNSRCTPDLLPILQKAFPGILITDIAIDG